MTTAKTYKVNGGRNPEYVILRTEEMKPNQARLAKETGKETKIYYMQGITRTGRKSKECLMCYRFESGDFLKVF